jgi:hypothetical protein
LKPEQKLQIEIVRLCLPALAPGAKLWATNIELPGGSKMFGLHQFVRKMMGAIPGTTDMVAAGRYPILAFAEVKRPPQVDPFGRRRKGGELGPQQLDCAAWCRRMGWPHAVWDDPEEAFRQMQAWRLIPSEREPKTRDDWNDRPPDEDFYLALRQGWAW